MRHISLLITTSKCMVQWDNHYTMHSLAVINKDSDFTRPTGVRFLEYDLDGDFLAMLTNCSAN